MPTCAAYPGVVARWTGDWLSAVSTPNVRDESQARWPGEKLGLPETGRDAAAGGGRRLLALVLDLLAASLLTTLFIQPQLTQPAVMRDFNTLAVGVWAVVTVTPAALFGFTPGMAACGIRVGRLDGSRLVGLWRALVRCALTFVVIPTAIRDRDGRGWHDRLTGTVVVRLR